jgi:hypothetical protein
VPGSKVAPSGRPAADKTTVRPKGSTAAKVKLTCLPNTVSTFSGMLRTGALAGVTNTAQLTVVAPNRTAMFEVRADAKGSAYNRNPSRDCPGRLTMTSGVFRSGVALETTRRATSGTLGVFNWITQSSQFPA